MKIISDLAQGGADWHKRRGKSIGSSDASVVLDIDPYRKRKDLLLDKAGIKKQEFKDNPVMQLGREFEAPARALFNLQFDLDVEPQVGVHDDYDFLLASFDGICLSSKTFVEIKYRGHKSLAALMAPGGVIPVHHIAQVQHQMLVSGFNKAYYVAYALSADKKEIDRIEFLPILRDDLYIDQILMPAEMAFWDEVQKLKNEHLSLRHGS